MAYTATTVSAAVAVNDTSIVVASATNFAAGNRLLIDQEEMQVAKNYTTGTTIPVLRGRNGTATAAHASGAGIVNGIGAADFVSPADEQQLVSPPRQRNLLNSQDAVASGATGSTATALSSVTPAVVAITGAASSGVGIPTGAAIPGAAYIFYNGTTGAVSIYAVGGTINGTTGTTAFSLTATGNKMAIVACVEAGKWLAFGNT